MAVQRGWYSSFSGGEYAWTKAPGHDDDDFQRVSDVRNSFPENDNSSNSCGTSFSKWKVLRESICLGLRMGGKAETEALVACGDLECSSVFNEMGLLQRHMKCEPSNKWSSRHSNIRAKLVNVEIPKEMMRVSITVNSQEIVAPFAGQRSGVERERAMEEGGRSPSGAEEHNLETTRETCIKLEKKEQTEIWTTK